MTTRSAKAYSDVSQRHREAAVPGFQRRHSLVGQPPKIFRVALLGSGAPNSKAQPRAVVEEFSGLPQTPLYVLNEEVEPTGSGKSTSVPLALATKAVSAEKTPSHDPWR